ncbi:hypothetical protein QTN47_04055 [Danxiaibacter flavus]|uniref:Outer membrane protein beta-barrel domain-containing protein n=1 Tax=Danxiaibacter flavus TaxID=3049108 RepID=A0ABV3Z9W0_9BACT|nr:hypothetical protein QNM32_04055 [Chitinophagaceae bacterium DXS]
MKRTLIQSSCLFLLLFFGFSMQKLNAQKLVFLFGHGIYDAPTGSMANYYNYGLGVEGGVGIGLNKTFLTGTIGYTNFFNKSGSPAGDLKYVPIKVGLRHYLVTKLLFFNLNAGVASVDNKLMSGSARFTADAGLGAKVGPLDLGINYDGFAGTNGVSSGWNSWFSFKAGFRIGL